jgi:hypothetical protein
MPNAIYVQSKDSNAAVVGTTSQCLALQPS